MLIELVFEFASHEIVFYLNSYGLGFYGATIAVIWQHFVVVFNKVLWNYNNLFKFYYVIALLSNNIDANFLYV